MKRPGRACLQGMAAGIASAVLAASPSPITLTSTALAQQDEQPSDDVGDWILRLFRGSEGSDDDAPQDRGRKGNAESGRPGSIDGGNGGRGGGDDDGGERGGDDGGERGGDDGGERGGDDGGGRGGGDDGGERGGGEGGEGGDD